MAKIRLDLPPYDDASVDQAYAAGGCEAVGTLFQTHPIHVGDCIRFGGLCYRIVAVEVLCAGGVVYEEGIAPPETAPDQTKAYLQSGTAINFWLQPISQQEYGAC
jgi:hypothetical protein